MTRLFFRVDFKNFNHLSICIYEEIEKTYIIFTYTFAYLLVVMFKTYI